MATVQLNSVQQTFLLDVHAIFNVRELQWEYRPDGRIWVSFVGRDDGPITNGRQRYADVPVSKLLDNEAELRAWAGSLWQFFDAVIQHAAA